MALAAQVCLVTSGSEQLRESVTQTGGGSCVQRASKEKPSSGAEYYVQTGYDCLFVLQTMSSEVDRALA